MARRTKVKKVFDDVVKIITGPPYVKGQRISIEVKHGLLSSAPMSAEVDAVGSNSLFIVFGGGKMVEVPFGLDGVPLQ
jgi:hypothetical protein